MLNQNHASVNSTSVALCQESLCREAAKEHPEDFDLLPTINWCRLRLQQVPSRNL
jgi:hypothetical protein